MRSSQSVPLPLEPDCLKPDNGLGISIHNNSAVPQTLLELAVKLQASFAQQNYTEMRIRATKAQTPPTHCFLPSLSLRKNQAKNTVAAG